jgi:hypothetical protein
VTRATPRQLAWLRFINASGFARKRFTAAELGAFLGLGRRAPLGAIRDLKRDGLVDADHHWLRISALGAAALVDDARQSQVCATGPTRCLRCNGVTFAPSKPCPLCAALRRQPVAIPEAS